MIDIGYGCMHSQASSMCLAKWIEMYKKGIVESVP